MRTNLLILAGFLTLVGLAGGVERAGANSGTASVYDAIGLGGRVACPPYRYRGGYNIVAHKTLACGTRVRFCYRGRCVRARVMDRGPFVSGRVWDLDVRVQRALRFPFGVAPVRATVLR